MIVMQMQYYTYTACTQHARFPTCLHSYIDINIIIINDYLISNGKVQ